MGRNNKHKSRFTDQSHFDNDNYSPPPVAITPLSSDQQQFNFIEEKENHDDNSSSSETKGNTKKNSSSKSFIGVPTSAIDKLWMKKKEKIDMINRKTINQFKCRNEQLIFDEKEWYQWDKKSPNWSWNAVPKIRDGYQMWSATKEQDGFDGFLVYDFDENKPGVRGNEARFPIRKTGILTLCDKDFIGIVHSNIIQIFDSRTGQTVNEIPITKGFGTVIAYYKESGHVVLLNNFAMQLWNINETRKKQKLIQKSIPCSQALDYYYQGHIVPKGLILFVYGNIVYFKFDKDGLLYEDSLIDLPEGVFSGVIIDHDILAVYMSSSILLINFEQNQIVHKISIISNSHSLGHIFHIGLNSLAHYQENLCTILDIEQESQLTTIPLTYPHRIRMESYNYETESFLDVELRQFTFPRGLLINNAPPSKIFSILFRNKQVPSSFNDLTLHFT